MRRLVLILAVLSGLALAETAAAIVVPGPNGPLIFTSGRDDGAVVLSDGHAQIWFLSAPNGTATRLTTLGLSHHRHAAWSPDRTKIAYARGPDDGTPFDGPWDIYVDDLTNPAAAPIQITNTAMNEDRPSWSPDGTRLAYAKQVAAATWEVVTKASDGTGAETRVATEASIGMGASGQFSRPQWTPDGQSIVYGRSGVDPGEYDIYRAAADGSQLLTGGTGIVTGTTNDYQPALSADGSRLCFTRQDMTGKDVWTATSTGASQAPLLTAAGDQYECAWSPDGTKIAFVEGAFGAGEILMRGSSGTGAVDPVTNDVGDARFDGNPEWTYNPAPTCADRSANVAFNGFVTIQLSCSDTPDPPGFQPNDPDPEILTQPSNGFLGGLNDGSVVYTPNVNFEGTDTFTYSGTDGTSTAAATVTISVAGPPPGPAPGGDTTAPVISRVSLSSRRFRRGSRLPAVSQRVRVGTTIRFDIDEAARATFTFHRVLPGRRVGGRCRTPSRRNRGKRRCTRYVRAGSFSLSAKAGANRVRFHGRLSRRKRLRPGKYRLTLGARDAAGNRSRARTARFTIVR